MNSDSSSPTEVEASGVRRPLKRWLILSQYYPPEIGAPQIRLRALARVLTQHGLDVAVLTAMPNYPAGRIFAEYVGRYQLTEEMDGITVRRAWVYAGTGRSACIRLANYFSFTCTALLDALTGPRPDVMFVESQPLSLGLVAILMKWLRRVPYVYNVPDLQIDVVGVRWKDRCARPAIWWKTRLILEVHRRHDRGRPRAVRPGVCRPRRRPGA